MHVAKKRKQEAKKEVPFAKFLPGDATWKGRTNKTRQDRMEAGNRDRVANAQRVYAFSQEHKPRRSSDWLKFRAH